MEAIHKRCCGLDVHKKVIVACLRILNDDGTLLKQVRTFATTTRALLHMSDWLTANGCTHVAMESTGVYWKPVYNLLEGSFELLLVNAKHMKAVPGRKTDVKDSEWIAELLQHGLLKGSFVPEAAQRELRDLTRLRTSLTREHGRAVNRLQKVLEDANIKLASVVTDVMGASARLMLQAIVAGETNPGLLANMAMRRLREKIPQLQEALTGRVKPHHQFMIQELLLHIDDLDTSIERLNQELEKRFAPFEFELALLDTIPGINIHKAQEVIAEIGVDMSRFGRDARLASWTAICPGNNESAGKRKSGKTREGNIWLKHSLIGAAHGASHTRDTYLQSQYHRLAGRRGKKKAIVAVAHSIIVIIYHVLNRLEPYKDLGANYFDERDQQAVQRRLVRRLERLGYQVTLQKTAA
jgi:transposase